MAWLCPAVAEGSIRLGILKVCESQLWDRQPPGCRGLDPIGDTESRRHLPRNGDRRGVAEGSIRLGILKAVRPADRRDHRAVAEGSIRLGILKAMDLSCANGQIPGCRGLDPIGDTERIRKAASTSPAAWLQRARSDWGY